MIKIRLHGTEQEVMEAVKSLEPTFKLLSVSTPYKDRGQSEYVRVYVDAEKKEV